MFTASVTESKNNLRISYRYVKYHLQYNSNKHTKLGYWNPFYPVYAQAFYIIGLCA